MFRAPSENVSWANYFSWGSKSFSNGTWRTGGVYHKFRTHKSNGWLSWSPQCSPQYNGQFGGPPQFKKYQQSSSFVIGNLYAPNVHHWSTVLCRMSRDCLWWHMWTYHNLSPAPLYNFFWLVVDLPLWKIWNSNVIIVPNIWKKSCSKPQTSCSKCISIWSSVSALLISASSLRGLNMMWFHARLAQQAKAGWIADNFGKEQELRLDVSHSSAF
jgi:hypothetical protein